MSIEIEQIDKRLSSLEKALTLVQQKLGLPPSSANWVEQVSGSLADIPEEDYRRFLECCRAVRNADAVEEARAMTYLLDTDHFSILQRKAGAEYLRLSTWMAQFSPFEFACCVVSLHEQVVGAHSFLNQAKNSAGLIRGYELLERLPRDYLTFDLLPFDAASANTYDGLLAQNLRIGAMDLRLAAIALSRDLTVLTRNLRDFGRVPGLEIDDRTM